MTFDDCLEALPAQDAKHGWSLFFEVRSGFDFGTAKYHLDADRIARSQAVTTEGSHARIQLEQPGWALCPHKPRSAMLSEASADSPFDWPWRFDLRLVHRAATGALADDAGNPLGIIGACVESSTDDDRVRCEGDGAWLANQALCDATAHDTTLLPDACRYYPEAGVIVGSEVVSTDTVRVHTSRPVGSLAGVDLSQFSVSMERLADTVHLTSTGGWLDNTLEYAGVFWCDDPAAVQPLAISSVAGDPDAFDLQFDASIQALCDDLDNPSDQIFSAVFAELSNGQSSVDARVLLDRAVKLHYKPSSVDPSARLVDDGGDPFALLDPIMVGNDQRVRFFEHFRVSGASPYITCFP